MLFAVLSGFILAILAPLIHRFFPRISGWIFAALPAALCAYLMTVAASGDGTIVQAYSWIPGLGINLSFSLDGLSLLFALLICGIGVLIFIYSAAYLAGHEHQGRFYSFLLGFMASMLGLVLADNLISVFVFWELTSLASYFLIGFDHEREAARSAALQALLVTAVGGLALLAGFLLLGSIGGSLEISGLSARGDAIRSHNLYAPIAVLVIMGAFTKSAQFPFHFWLPSAMEAPTPVSAYLHSATMVKAGVYLLARLSPVLGGTGLWQDTLVVFGGVTMVAGALLAFPQNDLKRILAYSTVSSLGTLVLLLGIGTPASTTAAAVYLFAHAFYKGSLFLVAGSLDHGAGTRNVLHLAGLRRAMPFTAAAGILAALSMAGVPPSLGYVGKELMYEAGLHSGRSHVVITAAMVSANALLFAMAAAAGAGPFLGKKIVSMVSPHEGPAGLIIGPLLLALAGTGLVFFPGLARPLLESAAAAIHGQKAEVSLALWHGLNVVLLLSGLTFLLGGVVYVLRAKVQQLLNGLRPAGPALLYDILVRGMLKAAEVQTKLLQNGKLRYYLMTVLASVPALILAAFMLNRINFFAPAVSGAVHFHEAAVGAMILTGTFLAVTARTRLTAIAALGVVGYGVALVYLFFSAPDLAMTQFSIETLMVILFVLVLYRLPRFALLSSPKARGRDIFVALANGGLVTALVLFALSGEAQSPISRFFMEQSVTAAHGRNTVNVILVDFRALDTLGEITVLAAAALGVYALLREFPERRERR
jgi:multicomponent Na+:H+ antiporter subunit A